MVAAAVLIAAVAFDVVAGEPPRAVHPVVWMGKFIGWFERRGPGDPKAQLAWGLRLVVAGTVLSFGATWLLLFLMGRLSFIAQAIVAAVLFKTTFAIGALAKQALKVRRELDAGRLDGARQQVGNLVSREVHELSERQVTAAAVESVAENTVDSIVAPLFWFLLLGVPGAMAYRFVNTADAMIGYHGHYEYLGKAAARLDDALNWLPARITWLLLVIGSWPAGLNAGHALVVGLRDHRRPESPNAGWTMAAAAGALNVPLEKVGQYHLGDDPARNLIPRKVTQAVGLMAVTSLVGVVLAALLELATPLGHLPWLA